MKIEQKYWDMAKYEPLTYLEVANKAIELQIEAQEQAQPVSWNTKYTDSTPKLSVGNSAFEDWFQAQPFATQTGIKQTCRDSYAAGMGDPLVTYATTQAQPEPLSSNFIQTVPDRCDRILWRGNYYHLPIKTSVAQPQPADPHAALRTEYAKQVALGTTGFYLWEFHIKSSGEWLAVTMGGRPIEPSWFKDVQYRYTDVSCYVSKDGEPADPHATLRAEYAKQMAEGTTGFYLWEYRFSSNQAWTPLDHEEFFPDHRYRCTDISCMVSKDGEPAIRMLRTEALALQRQTKDTHDWYSGKMSLPWEGEVFCFDANVIYIYKTESIIKLDGKMVTPAQAMAEWKAKKDTHDIWYKNCGMSEMWVQDPNYFRWHAKTVNDSEYEIRTKQPKLTQIDWSRVPVGVMTKAGEFRGAYLDDSGYLMVDRGRSDTSGILVYPPEEKTLRLAPASEQKWIAVQDDAGGLYEGLSYAKQYDHMLCPISYKVIGLADGYTDGGDI
jgi:hypothetical protein